MGSFSSCNAIHDCIPSRVLGVDEIEDSGADTLGGDVSVPTSRKLVVYRDHGIRLETRNGG